MKTLRDLEASDMPSMALYMVEIQQVGMVLTKKCNLVYRKLLS